MSKTIEKLFTQVTSELEKITISHAEPIILDAATGAGNCALRIGRMLRSGKVITVDKDPDAWTNYALPKVESAGLTNQIEFHKMDISKLVEFADGYFDMVFSGATLSTMGIDVVDGIKELYRVAKPGALLAIYDLLPQEEPKTLPQQNAVDAWRIAKAIDVLSGEQHYEELPLKWICQRLQDTGSKIEYQDTEVRWGMAPEESTKEYLASEAYMEIQDEATREFFRKLTAKIKEKIRKEGMATFSRRYILCARKPA